MTTGLIILAVIILLFAIVLFAMWLRGKKIDEMYPDTVQRIADSCRVIQIIGRGIQNLLATKEGCKTSTGKHPIC